MSGIASNPRRLALLMMGAIVSALILALVKPALAADFSFGGELFLGGREAVGRVRLGKNLRASKYDDRRLDARFRKQ